MKIPSFIMGFSQHRVSKERPRISGRAAQQRDNNYEDGPNLSFLDYNQHTAQGERANCICSHTTLSQNHNDYRTDEESDSNQDVRDPRIKELETRLEKPGAELEMSKEQREASRKRYENLRTDHDELKKKSEADQRTHHQICGERDRLQKELKANQEGHNKVRKEQDELQKKFQTNQELYDKVNRERNDLDKKFVAFRALVDKRWKEREAAHQRHRKEWLEEQQRLRRNLNLSQKDVESQKLNIAELKIAVSRSVNTDGTTTRDDDYFEAQFASLASAIRKWVFLRSRGAPLVKHKDLSKTLLESLRRSVSGYSELEDTTMSLEEVEAVVVERLCSHVFRPDFVLIGQGKLYNLDYICKAFAGTDLKKREWHAQTVGMIFANDQYDDHLRDNTRVVEEDLQQCSSILAGGKDDEKRRKTLPTIVEKAAMLHKEVFREISPFELHQIKPGDPYDPLLMQDRSNLAQNDEGEGEGEGGSQVFIVKMVLFPPVLRYEFDEDGKSLETPIVVRKGEVIAMHSED